MIPLCAIATCNQGRYTCAGCGYIKVQQQLHRCREGCIVSVVCSARRSLTMMLLSATLFDILQPLIKQD
jgi:hypothetical protein